jgi:galactokinase
VTDRIIARAPGRVNLIGDHTDYTGGLVFPMAIDRWTEIDGTPTDRIRLVSDDEPDPVDLPATVAAADVMRVEPRWGRFVAAIAAELRSGRGFDGRVATTIPVGAGLSSSAALEVAVALALGFDGTPLELAQLARRAEHAATGVPTGIMDQLCIAGARQGHAALIDCHTLEVTPVPVPDDAAIVVQFVAHRTLVGSEYSDRVGECTRAESIVGPLRTATLDDIERIDDELVRRRARHVITENARVTSFAEALARGDHVGAGELMVASHRSLSDDFAVSTPTVDRAVRDLLDQPGVFGARMTGGGFGGCVVALCRPDATVPGHRVWPVDGASVTTGRPLDDGSVASR